MYPLLLSLKYSLLTSTYGSKMQYIQLMCIARTIDLYLVASLFLKAKMTLTDIYF